RRAERPRRPDRRARRRDFQVGALSRSKENGRAGEADSASWPASQANASEAVPAPPFVSGSIRRLQGGLRAALVVQRLHTFYGFVQQDFAFRRHMLSHGE